MTGSSRSMQLVILGEFWEQPTLFTTQRIVAVLQRKVTFRLQQTFRRPLCALLLPTSSGYLGQRLRPKKHEMVIWPPKKFSLSGSHSTKYSKSLCSTGKVTIENESFCLTSALWMNAAMPGIPCGTWFLGQLCLNWRLQGWKAASLGAHLTLEVKLPCPFSSS